MVKAIITMAVSLFMLSACSYQYKIVDPGATTEEVEATMDRIQDSSREQELIGVLRQDINSVVYFTRSGSNGLLPESVFSIERMNPFSSVYASSDYSTHVFETGLQEASIAFLDAYREEGGVPVRYFALMIELNFSQTSGPLTYSGVSRPGQYGFTDEAFEVQFPAENGNTLLLRTYDLDEDFQDTLGSNIQFKVYEVINGQEFKIGQFSALAGFSS